MYCNICIVISAGINNASIRSVRNIYSVYFKDGAY